MIKQMSGRLTHRRWRPLAMIAAALYVVVLFTAPFDHHDLLCHIKTPRHCTSCVSSQLGSDPTTSAMFGSWQLADAGSAIAFEPLAEGAVLALLSTGRSPPVLA
jgi:hypothetical protein